jgi:hypothetical protein
MGLRGRRRRACGRDELGGFVNIKAFFVDAVSRALDLEIATHADVLRFATTDVLSIHLPRPLWARLLSACLNAPRVDAKLIVETVGVPNLCEHIPAHIIWACISDVAKRSLGANVDVSDTPTKIGLAAAAPRPIQIAPPPEVVVVTPRPKSGPVIIPTRSIPPVQQPIADIIDDLEQPAHTPRNSQPRLRQAQTALGRSTATPVAAAGTARRPQAAATPARSRRTTDAETETDLSEISVDDSQLVDWQTTEETQTSHDEFSRKR